MAGSDAAKSSLLLFSQFADLVSMQNINFNEKNIQLPPPQKASVTNIKGKKNKVWVHRALLEGEGSALAAVAEFNVEKRPKSSI